MKTELLKLLCRNARYTDEELAVMLGSDEKTVRETIEELEKEGIIRGYKAVIDWDSLDDAYVSAIVELNVVNKLVEDDVVVITVGGGGIPVVETENGLQGTAAVIDKDKSCARLAMDLGADILMILTAVDRVCINFNKPDQKALAEINLADCARYISEGHFAPGSMLPKVEACVQFVESAPGREALITSLEKAGLAMTGETGTKIIA